MEKRCGEESTVVEISNLVRHPVFSISGISVLLGDVDVFFLSTS